MDASLPLKIALEDTPPIIRVAQILKVIPMTKESAPKPNTLPISFLCFISTS